MAPEAQPKKTYLQSLTLDELAEKLLPLSTSGLSRTGEVDQVKQQKQARMRAKQIFNWAYQRHVLRWDEMSDLAKTLREWLKENLEIFELPVAVEKQSEDGTYKFLWNLKDHKTIESVIIPSALKEKSAEAAFESLNPRQANTRQAPHYPVTPSHFAGKKAHADAAPLDKNSWERLTACISSQVGCAMGCKFCLTGIQGLDRSLEAHEIVAQVHALRMRAPITNIVFMGMGEPLHNVKNVSQACKILLAEDGMNFSKRKVTVSTSGLVPGIEELYKNIDVSLAISLNASTDEQRSQIMPVNKKWNLEALLTACKKVPLGSHRRITFEYVLLKDFNDQPDDAKRVVQLLSGIPAKVNLIPFNEHPAADFKRPSDETVMRFQKIIQNAGLTATVRISRGRDILAACGQLRSLFGTARGTEKHRDYSTPSSQPPTP